MNDDIRLSKKQLLIIGGIALAVLITIIIVFLVNNSATEQKEPSLAETAAAEQIALGDAEREKWPIIEYLPIKNSLFTIGYIVDGENFTINISTSSTYLDQAISKMKSLDSDIGQYNIEIKNFDNPFAIEQSPSSANDPQDFIIQTFKNATKQFVVQAGNKINDYYYTTITTGDAATYSLVTYRIVLKMTDSNWSVLNIPSPAVTIQNAPDVPSDIRILVNNLN